VVAAFAQINNYILVALDGDMKEIAKSIGLQNRQYSQLSLLKLTGEEWKAADRVASAMTLIEHEWHYSQSPAGARRIFIEIRTHAINLRR
jgi:predicted nuclease of predicted toxin-antitoxin system